MEVFLYSDGSSRENPGPGGFGTILRCTDAQGQVHEKEFSAAYACTTNNRMELLGVITGFEALKRPCSVVVVSDSQYVIKAFTGHWINSWQARGWKNAKKEPVKNVDLWKRLLRAIEPHTVTWQWVKGHNEHPENERCDALACAAADSGEFLHDTEYEASLAPQQTLI